jgi:hypothetical protein
VISFQFSISDSATVARNLRHASECGERAKRTDPATKMELLGQERRWLSLAYSYEFAGRLTTTPFSNRPTE